MSNTINLAKREFVILEKTVDNAIISPFKDEILALVDKFGNSGQSGGSAPFTAEAISSAVKKLCLLNPICDITGHDDEWNELFDNDKRTYQNNRLGSIFKEGENGKPYYLDAIIFKGQSGSCFTGSSVELKNGKNIGSRQFIKFPFKPKSFYIDVIETEWHKSKETGKLTKKEGGGWWTSIVKDEKQLDEVFEYYEKPDAVV